MEGTLQFLCTRIGIDKCNLSETCFSKNVNIITPFDKPSVCLCFGRIIVKNFYGISPVLGELWISLEVLARNLLNFRLQIQIAKKHSKEKTDNSKF